MGSNPVVVTKISVTAPVSSKDFLDIQAYCACFQQGFPWHSGYWVYIHSKTRMWHNKTGFPLEGDWGISALPQKCWFCDFHSVFGHFAKLSPHKSTLFRRTHSQMCHWDKLSKQSSIVSKASMDEWFTVPLGAQRLWVQIRCNHLNFGHCNCFEQGVPWNSEH